MHHGCHLRWLKQISKNTSTEPASSYPHCVHAFDTKYLQQTCIPFFLHPSWSNPTSPCTTLWLHALPSNFCLEVFDLVQQKGACSRCDYIFCRSIYSHSRWSLNWVTKTVTMIPSFKLGQQPSLYWPEVCRWLCYMQVQESYSYFVCSAGKGDGWWQNT